MTNPTNNRAFSKNKRGFTLLEVLLAVAIITILAGIATPIYYSFFSRNNLDLAVSGAAQNARRAQALSRAGMEDDGWGVYVETGRIVLFKGDQYSTRDTSFDEETVFSSTIVVSGTQEFVFEKISGIPQTAGTTVFTLGSNNRTLDVNEKGMIEF